MKFAPNKPFETTKPAILVDGGLSPGQYRFRLVVVNTAGVASKPADVIVTVELFRTITVPQITSPAR